MLEDLKILLGFDLNEKDEELDRKLNLLLDSARRRLKILLGGIDPPKEMNHIVTEVAVIRFNRLGSEGLESHSVEGESASYGDNDFAGFKDEIQAFLDTQKDVTKGRLRFL